MEKQFILVLQVKEACRPTYLEPLVREKACFPVRVQWMVFCGGRQLYNIVVSQSKVGKLKSCWMKQSCMNHWSCLNI